MQPLQADQSQHVLHRPHLTLDFTGALVTQLVLGAYETQVIGGVHSSPHVLS